MKINSRFKTLGAVCLAVSLSLSFSGCVTEQPVAVQKAPLPAGYILGMDASAVLAEELSGVTYYGFDGQPQDVFKTLAEAGVNTVRLRLWNDPYDEEGRGYGGGNNDLDTTIQLGRRATEAGMGVCVDFHYSDFWADPQKQMSPKAWKDLSVADKAAALEAFTRDSLSVLLNEGVNVTCVQIGNEINNGMSGEKYPAVYELLKAGSKAVRDIAAAYEREIKIIVHYTNIENPDYVYKMAQGLKNASIDYDIFGISYYPYWHGTLSNMQTVVSKLRELTAKEVIIAETSYPYTAADGDGFDNSFTGQNRLVGGYPATVQGQEDMVSAIAYLSLASGATGIMYWEGTWIPVGDTARENRPLWQKYGSGWATSYAASYDPRDAGQYYGGCSWDNQAMFDFKGHPLESLKVFLKLKNYAAPAQ